MLFRSRLVKRDTVLQKLEEQPEWFNYAAASPIEAIIRTPFTHISRFACRHARPASKRNCRIGPHFRLGVALDDVADAVASLGGSRAPWRSDHARTMRSTRARLFASMSSLESPSPASTLTKSIKNSAGLKCSGHSNPMDLKYVTASSLGP